MREEQIMELFIKRFIDLLDEEIPVSLVHTLTEQPLGAVMVDHYVRIHARLDLIDEESPFVEIELYPYSEQKLVALYAYTYPIQGLNIGESEFINKLKSDNKINAEKIVPIDNEKDYFYEIFYEEELEIPENNAMIDGMINKLVPAIKEWMTIGGYEKQKEE